MKNEIGKRSFKGGSKKQGSRLQGARRALGKGWAEVLRNNNLDWGLSAKEFNIWQPSGTRQEAYGGAQKNWERVMRKGKLYGFLYVCLTFLQFCCAYFGDLVVEYHLDTCDLMIGTMQRNVPAIASMFACTHGMHWTRDVGLCLGVTGGR